MPADPNDKKITLDQLTTYLNTIERDSETEFTNFSIDPATDSNELEYVDFSNKSGLGPFFLKILDQSLTGDDKNAWQLKGYYYQFSSKLYIESKIQLVAAFRVDSATVVGTQPAPASTIAKIVTWAEGEWNWFGQQEYNLDGHTIRQGKQESQDDASDRVGTYWKVGVKIQGRTGKTKDQPWSAAFVSYIMRQAGAGEHFVYSEAHRTYIFAAIKAAKYQDTFAGFWGFRLTERSPQVGDLICAWRPDETFKGPVTFDDAKAEEGSYPAHCDIVVTRTATEIVTIGGNVGNSVTKKHYRLDSSGLLTPANYDKGFAVLANRLDTFATTAPANPVGGQSPGAPQNATHTKFTIDTNLKTTKSPLTVDTIRKFFADKPNGRDSLKDIAEPVIAASEKYQINATYIVAHAIQESGWGLAPLSKASNNLFGWGAIDENPGQLEHFASRAQCIDKVMGYINDLYLTPTGKEYRTAPVLGDKQHGMNVKYALEKTWGQEIADLANEIEASL